MHSNQSPSRRTDLPRQNKWRILRLPESAADSIELSKSLEGAHSTGKAAFIQKYLSGYEGFVAFKGVQINALPTGAIYLCLLYEYLTNTVDQAFEEMMSRKLSTNQIKLHFWKALLCAIKCLGMLEKANVYHGNINYSHLQLRLAELTPPKLFFNPSQPTSI